MGAWEQMYEYPKTYSDVRYGTGLTAIKKALIDQGYTKGIKIDTKQFGNYVRDRVKEFQSNVGLEVDGVVGPKTSKELFEYVALNAQEAKDIPDNLLYKKTKLESNFDPAAVGNVDPHDRGMNQINSVAHPSVFDEEAFDPHFSLPWAASYLSGFYEVTNDWDASLAAYNIGLFYAKKWLAAGKPTAGVFTSTGKDIAVIATRYVSLVRSQTV